MLGSLLTGLRFARELVIVGGELGSALYQAVRGVRREDDERAPELVVDREKASGQAGSDAGRNAGKVRPVPLPIADRVIGCRLCGKPCALVGNPIPVDGRCQWCRDEGRFR